MLPLYSLARDTYNPPSLISWWREVARRSRECAKQVAWSDYSFPKLRNRAQLSFNNLPVVIRNVDWLSRKCHDAKWEREIQTSGLKVSRQELYSRFLALVAPFFALSWTNHRDLLIAFCTMTIAYATRKGCPLRETPFEIMEMIFGNVHFSHILELLSTAKWIRVEALS